MWKFYSPELTLDFSNAIVVILAPCILDSLSKCNVSTFPNLEELGFFCVFAFPNASNMH
jgi:hypothetical protein